MLLSERMRLLQVQPCQGGRREAFKIYKSYLRGRLEQAACSFCRASSDSRSSLSWFSICSRTTRQELEKQAETPSTACHTHLCSISMTTTRTASHSLLSSSKELRSDVGSLVERGFGNGPSRLGGLAWASGKPLIHVRCSFSTSIHLPIVDKTYGAASTHQCPHRSGAPSHRHTAHTVWRRMRNLCVDRGRFFG